jgi:hypothetical protein
VSDAMLRQHTNEEVGDYDDGFKAGFKGRHRFVFSDCSENMDRQAVGLGEVDGYEVDTALHQVRNKSHVAGEAI